MSVRSLLGSIALGALLALGLGACSTTEPATTPATVSYGGAQEAPTSMLAFGETHTWPGGDTVTVGQPEVREVHDDLQDRNRTYLVVPVTVTNHGDAAKQTISYLVDAAMDSVALDTGLLGDDVVDPSGSVPPGGKRSFQEVFELTTASGEVEVSVMGEMFDPQRPTVFFTGSV